MFTKYTAYLKIIVTFYLYYVFNISVIFPYYATEDTEIEVCRY